MILSESERQYIQSQIEYHKRNILYYHRRIEEAENEIVKLIENLDEK